MGREDCVALTVRNDWRDAPCYYRLNFICEIRGDVVVKAPTKSGAAVVEEIITKKTSDLIHHKTCTSTDKIKW